MHLTLVASKRRKAPDEFAEFAQRLGLAYSRCKRITGKGHNQIANTCDVDQGSLTKWLQGKSISQISVVSAIRLSRGLDVDYTWLTTGVGAMAPASEETPARPRQRSTAG